VLIVGGAQAADVTAPSDASEVSPATAARAARDVSPLAAREALLGEQAATARTQARWRLRALYRLAVSGGDTPPLTRARALDAGARALARDLGEARILDAERVLAAADREAREAAARAEPTPGAAPSLALPVAGAVVARFGVAPQPPTGLLVSRTGVRLAAAAGAEVRAPAAGTVARVEPEGGAWTAVIDHGAGWTSIVSGLGQASLEAGARVAAGQRLGAARASGGVGFEVWRGLRPVDPILLARP
jgi:murein DD-endopeptidase MepM/ murein hydrolase activator NlpD